MEPLRGGYRNGSGTWGMEVGEASPDNIGAELQPRTAHVGPGRVLPKQDPAGRCTMAGLEIKIDTPAEKHTHPNAEHPDHKEQGR